MCVCVCESEAVAYPLGPPGWDWIELKAGNGTEDPRGERPERSPRSPGEVA